MACAYGWRSASAKLNAPWLDLFLHPGVVDSQLFDGVVADQ